MKLDLVSKIYFSTTRERERERERESGKVKYEIKKETVQSQAVELIKKHLGHGKTRNYLFSRYRTVEMCVYSFQTY